MDLPSEFTWRGKRHVVRRLERMQSAVRQGRYHLTTADGLRCIVSQDHERRTWHIERVLPNQSGGSGGWK
ncbi:MAG: hypothetical protein MUO23_01255 [Anaerolineales bacterium]|nr:hypothetical protein [Anaerolineales bacterium]